MTFFKQPRSQSLDSAPSAGIDRGVAVAQDLGQVAEVTVEQFADAFVVLQAEGVVVAVGRRQRDEGVQGEGQAVAVEELGHRRRPAEGRQVEVGQVAEAAEGIGAQQRLWRGNGEKTKASWLARPCA